MGESSTTSRTSMRSRTLCKVCGYLVTVPAQSRCPQAAAAATFNKVQVVTSMLVQKVAILAATVTRNAGKKDLTRRDLLKNLMLGSRRGGQLAINYCLARRQGPYAIVAASGAT